MRSRFSFILIALAIPLALVATGCGDDKSSSGNSTQSTNSGSTGSNGAATESAKKTLEACKEAAEALPDEDRVAKATQNCEDSYENIKDPSAKIDQATSDARAKCEEAAGKIPNEDAKASASAACAQFK
jgi:hypothetical protein